MKHTLILFLVLLLTPLATLQAAETFLVENGQPRAEIIIADNPQRSVRLADACNQILSESVKNKTLYRFKAEVEVSVYNDTQPNLNDLKQWLIRAARLYVDYHDIGLKDGTLLVSIDWSKMEGEE